MVGNDISERASRYFNVMIDVKLMLDKMAVMRTLMKEYMRGNVMEAEDSTINMIRSIKPQSIGNVGRCKRNTTKYTTSPI